MVAATALTKRYGRTLALDGVDLSVAAGDVYAILGPNGAGKSTLIHILCTIHAPDSGHASIAGVDVVTDPLKARRQLGVVFQEPSLDTRLTVFENLDFHGRIFGVPNRLRRRRITELLELVELTDWRDRLVRELSKGMQRRLEVARALVHDAAVLVLDEPTVGLDAQTRARMWQHLADLRGRRDLTVLVTTHYIEEVEACDRVCIIDRGKVLASGTPRELKARHGTSVVRVASDDDAVLARLRAEHPQASGAGSSTLAIPIDGDGVVTAILERHGASLRSFDVEAPSLESVFLSLTGRHIRDRGADPNDRLLAFGRQGGENTR